MSINSNLSALNKLGQSIWYDNCSRDILESGELKQLINSGVSGLTSNPTIFKNAIADSNDYDQEIKRLSASNSSVEEICEELMVQDVGAAADLLQPIYADSSGRDGFASIEVSPLLAGDTQGTIEAAEHLWKKLDRPNVMIKIPATAEGIPAIQKAIELGINVNVTLIFSVKAYEQVMNAYLSGLEARQAAGADISHVNSVASFFVSRLDALTEKKMDAAIEAGSASADDKASLVGKVGIANSKLAYQKFEEHFGSERFEALKKHGAALQRPLWASTGTKNPDLSPVLYVEELAGDHTVNTLPPKTLKALMEQATIEPRLHSGLEQATQLLNSLEGFGLNLEDCLTELLEAGVKSFSDSFEELLEAIKTKRGQLAA